VRPFSSHVSKEYDCALLRPDLAIGNVSTNFYPFTITISRVYRGYYFYIVFNLMNMKPHVGITCLFSQSLVNLFSPLKGCWDINTHTRSWFFCWVCLRRSLLSISVRVNRMTSSHLSCNSCCNSLLARITKQFNCPDVWFLVATSLATEKISVATQLASQLHKSRCKSNDLEFY
jgi:hypothetical protein